MILTGTAGSREAGPGWYRLIYDPQGNEAFDVGPALTAIDALKLKT